MDMTQETTPPMTPEQVKLYIKKHYALGLPSGSVRALLALITFGGIWAWMWLRPDAEVPEFLRNLMFIIMGHYFAARHQANDEVGPAPLYLPRGSIRTLLLAGFAVLAGALIYQNRMLTRVNGEVRLSHASVALILVGGFMLGVLRSRLAGKSAPRYVEDFRAIISLAAGVVLILLVFGFVRVDPGSTHGFKHWALHYRLEDFLAAVVGFYFGSRS